MSYSSLWRIKPDFGADETITAFKNSWLFSPVIWDVLLNKYLPVKGDKRIYISAVSINNEIYKDLNAKINESPIIEDRISWELSQMQAFFSKDKEVVAKAIKSFWKVNKAHDDGYGEHIKIRFNEIADSILAIDSDAFPYFVFKCTSCDDNVECWFDDGKTLKDATEFVVGFVIIENGLIKGWANNVDFCKNDNDKL